MTRRWVVAGLALALALSGLWAGSRPTTIRVTPGDDLSELLEQAPQGAIVSLAAGGYRGPIHIRKPLTLRADEHSFIAADASEPVVTVVADDVVIEGLTTRGGNTGIVVREAEGVSLRAVEVAGADLHGIEIVDASAHVSGAEISDLQHPMAQGIEIRNSDGRPDSLIEGSSIRGGMEGIVSHVSESTIADNVVQDTTMRGITVTEMSDGVVKGNRVHDVTGAGMYCGDMSRCQFQDNVVVDVQGDRNGRSTAGWGIVVTYHAVASSEGDRLEGAAGPRMASIGGHFRNRSPLEPGAGWGALVPSGLAALAALALTGLLYLGSGLFARSLDKGGTAGPAGRGPAWLPSLAVLGLGVQTFHMIEHALQVFRVRVDGIPSRGGIVGPGVEAEWVHFAYNAAVLGGLLLAVVARRRGWRPPGRVELGDRLLLTAAAIQGYHALEHSVKLGQHLATGAKVNHGILGGEIDLVLLHFSINLAVYLSAVGATVAYLWGVRLGRRLRTSALRYG